MICEHLIIDEEETSSRATTIAAIPACMNDNVEQQETSSFKKVAEITTPTIKNSGKRRFLSPKEFLNLGSDTIKRKIKPVQKWTTLTKDAVYLLKRVVEMEVQMKSGPQIGHYAELEDENEETINVWITSIILNESKKYELADNDASWKDCEQGKRIRI